MVILFAGGLFGKVASYPGFPHFVEENLGIITRACRKVDMTELGGSVMWFKGCTHVAFMRRP